MAFNYQSPVSNPPGLVPLQQRPATRIVTAGTILILANTSAVFSGSDMRQDRIQIVITNLDPSLLLKLQTLNGVNFGTAFPQRPITFETSAGILVTNTNNSDVQCEVMEIFPDTGNQHGIPAPRTAGVASGGGGGGGGASSAGSSSGGGSFSQAGGGSQPR